MKISKNDHDHCPVLQPDTPDSSHRPVAWKVALLETPDWPWVCPGLRGSGDLSWVDSAVGSCEQVMLGTPRVGPQLRDCWTCCVCMRTTADYHLLVLQEILPPPKQIPHSRLTSWLIYHCKDAEKAHFLNGGGQTIALFRFISCRGSTASHGNPPLPSPPRPRWCSIRARICGIANASRQTGRRI